MPPMHDASERLFQDAVKRVARMSGWQIFHASPKQVRLGQGEKMPTTLICPRCDGLIPNNITPGAYVGALSRLDNKTEICSSCGTEEAMEDYLSGSVVNWQKS